MDKAESIVTVDDAIKKLVLLDSKDKIWTQEVLLQVTDKAVCLLDCDTQVGTVPPPPPAQWSWWRGGPTLVSLLQEELENFPLSTIHMSQTVQKLPRYPSVLLLVCQDSDQHRPDIHFFHCDEVDVSLDRGGRGWGGWGNHGNAPCGLTSGVFLQAEIVHADIDSAIGDNRHGKKMRPQTLK